MRKKIMPDISMCNDYSCPQFEKCYRAQAKPSEYRQSYFRDSPRDKDGCNYFWPTFNEQIEELQRKERESSPRHRNKPST